MGISLGWLFWLFLKTKGGEKDQPPAQSPDAATPKQTQEEVDHLFEVVGAMAARVSALQPKAGVSVLPARSAGREEPAVPGQGPRRPPARGRGLRCHCSASAETPTEVTAGAEEDIWAETERWLRGPGIDKPSTVRLIFIFIQKLPPLSPSSPPYRYQYESLNHTLLTKTWNRLLAERSYFLSFFLVLVLQC